MKADTSNVSLSSDTAGSCQKQKLVMPQTCRNSSSEIRARKRSVPLRAGSFDSHVNEQLELLNLDTSLITDRGHRFISANLSQPTWCDKCGDFIWGVYKRCLICTSMLTLLFFILIFNSTSIGKK